MPKVYEPQIKLVLRKEKPLKDGTMPIFLRVSFNGVKERATGYSCDMAHWDASGERVLRGFPNFKVINEELNRIKSVAVEERTKQRVNGKGFDIAIILRSGCVKNDAVDSCATNTFSGLVGAYLASHSLSYNTRQAWVVVRNRLISCFGDDTSQWDIDKFVKRCEADGLSDSTMSLLMGKVKALGLNIKNFNINRYKCAIRQHYIDKRAMLFVKSRLLGMIAHIKGNTFTFTDEYIESFNKPLSTPLWSLYIYYLLYLTALAPIDLAFLKKENVELKYIGSDEYFIIKGNRCKTGVPFVISIKRNLENNILIWGLLMFNKGEYLTPICNGLTDKDRMNHRQRNVILRCSKHLKKLFDDINQDIIKHNFDEKDNVPIIDKECTYYSARHSRATQIYNSPDATLGMLTTMLGRSPSNISVYLKQLSSESDLKQMGDIIDV